ncbi:hypothetical protein DFA_04439 [Cavenderia fasciculata]|uniref:ComC supersandwich domain-containing protein n=1 Tax=Cavenderia fasciculata TaxID=261658 RepID=F4PPK8_CACFS|nr:uncharacterized protein DFA_04439 [Cavenderia fasciculata]EGG22321.1 hypothetical protein DFA_04439 [Cavenderia fasciculata]|eukprot:XP_004360172.1 hypothetical protein DFA_04439 [Cavenderia fasciculata]
MIAIQEIDSDDNIVNELLTNNWNSTLTVNNQTQTTTVNYQLNNSDTTAAQVIATISFSQQPRDIHFGNQVIHIDSNSIKLSVNISDWTFSTFLTTLRVIFKTTINNDQSIEFDCQDVNIDTLTYDQLSNNIQYLRVVKDNIQFTGRFIDYVLSDGRPTFSKTSIINKTAESSSSSDQSTVLIGISMPQCQSCALDPDFTPLLIDKSAESGCDSKSNTWRIIVGVVVGVFGAVAIAVASVILIKKKRVTKRYNKNMQQKLSNMSTYIRQLIFNHVGVISNRLYPKDKSSSGRQRLSLKGRDIIKLPFLGMISKYGLPWHFVRHYLPSDCTEILLKRRKRVITQYCCHPNATLDTLKRLVEWSNDDVGFDWEYLKGYNNNKNSNNQQIRNQEILEYLIKRCQVDRDKDDFLICAMDVACTYGYLSSIKLIKKIIVKSYYEAIGIASSNGFIDIVKYLHENGAEGGGTKDEGCSTKAMDEAAQNGHLEVVKYLHFNRTEGATTYAMNNAAGNGHIEIVKFLHEHRQEGCTRAAVCNASGNGHIDVVKFLSECRTEDATYAMDMAAGRGHIEIVKYLQEHRSEGATINAMDWAAQNGHIEVVKYLQEHRTEGVTTWAMDLAALLGYTETVKYLSEHRTEGATTMAMDNAAGRGHIEMVKYLHFNRTEGAVDALDRAAQNGHIEMVKYLHFNRSEGATTDAMDRAARNGHIEIVKFLSEHRTEGASKEAMDQAARKGHIEMVKYLQEHRSEGATTDAMDWAAGNGHIEIVKYLHFNGSEGCTSKAIQSACEGGHLEVASFLVNVRNEKCNQELLQNNERKKMTVIIIMTTTSTTFHSIFRAQYIRQLIFNHVGVISNLLYPKEYKSSIYETDDDDDESGRYDGSGGVRQRSLVGRDIIKLPLFGMISKFAMPWEFVCHYLPKDDCSSSSNDRDQVQIKRRKRVITQYCLHPNATLDTLNHLLEWCQDDIDWVYLTGNINVLRNQEILENLINRCQVDEDKDHFLISAMDVACTNGFLSSVKLIKKSIIKSYYQAIVIASSRGFIDIVKYLHENRTEGGGTKEAMDEAARHGHLDIVKVSSITEGATKWAMDGAAGNGHIEIVKYLSEHRSEGETTDALDWAAQNGHIEIVRYLSEHRSEGATTDALDWAAQNGHIEIVRYLSEHRSEGATTYAMDLAARNGHIEIVQYLHFNRSEGCSRAGIKSVCEKGLLEIASFLINVRNEKCDEELLHTASMKGHYDIVKLMLPQFTDIEPIQSVIQHLNAMDDHFEIIHLLENHLHLLIEMNK